MCTQAKTYIIVHSYQNPHFSPPCLFAPLPHQEPLWLDSGLYFEIKHRRSTHTHTHTHTHKHAPPSPLLSLVTFSSPLLVNRNQVERAQSRLGGGRSPGTLVPCSSRALIQSLSLERLQSVSQSSPSQSIKQPTRQAITSGLVHHPDGPSVPLDASVDPSLPVAVLYC